MRGGGLDVRRQLGDLVTEPIQLAEFHERVPLPLGRTLHPGFRAAAAPAGRTIAPRSMIFREGPGHAGLAGPACAAETASARDCRNAVIPHARGCQTVFFMSARG